MKRIKRWNNKLRFYCITPFVFNLINLHNWHLFVLGVGVCFVHAAVQVRFREKEMRIIYKKMAQEGAEQGSNN